MWLTCSSRRDCSLECASRIYTKVRGGADGSWLERLNAIRATSVRIDTPPTLSIKQYLSLFTNFLWPILATVVAVNSIKIMGHTLPASRNQTTNHWAVNQTTRNVKQPRKTISRLPIVLWRFRSDINFINYRIDNTDIIVINYRMACKHVSEGITGNWEEHCLCSLSSKWLRMRPIV